MRRLCLFAFALAALALAACGQPRLRRTLPPDVRVDTYDQQAASQIDVLWVVDNSGSMAPRQENLARNFQSFIETFTTNAVDYRIAVATTDIFRDAGKLFGNPRILTPTTPDVLTRFSNNIKVGINGSPFEAGLEASRLVIDTQLASNAQLVESCKNACPSSKPACPSECETNTDFPFLRKNAYLYVIYVSDEEDRSDQDVRFYWRYLETAKGIGNDGTVTTAAIMGDVPSNGCGATPGARYQALSDLTGGEVGSICDPNFAVTLKKLATNAVGLKRKFALQSKPNIETLQVFVKYACNTPDNDDRLAHCTAIDKELCQDNPADSINLVCTPQQGGPDGWSYEAMNNVVYFAGESVPGLGGTVELQYYEEGKGP